MSREVLHVKISRQKVFGRQWQGEIHMFVPKNMFQHLRKILSDSDFRDAKLNLYKKYKRNIAESKIGRRNIFARTDLFWQFLRTVTNPLIILRI